MQRQEAPPSRPRAAAMLGMVGLALLALGLGIGLLRTPRPAPASGVGGPDEPPLRVALAAVEPTIFRETAAGGHAAPARPADELGPVFRSDEGPLPMRIGRGETFYEALAARGAAHEDIMALVEACGGFRDLTKVRRGEEFRVHVAPDGGLRSVGFDLDTESHVAWVRAGDTYERVDGTYPVEHRFKGIGGTVEISLYASLQDLDAPLALAAKLNDILGWDIDFSRDLRRGDTFRIVYEEIWKDGAFVRTGPIQMAEVVNRGRAHRAVRFADAEGRPGYYDPEGRNLQKQLMRAPLEYSRISSGFSYNRLHPVLKRWMPHLGVDYAAPLGTPVRAAGDGEVLAATRKKGNGRYIRIRHTNREYETYYLHLSRFADGVRRGTRVRQGEVIGYVGASGYATGPHLDYRVKVGGRFMNPRKLKLPAAAPVADGLRDAFLAEAERCGAVLSAITTGPPVDLPALTAPPPPGWDATVYAAGGLPDGVRAAH